MSSIPGNSRWVLLSSTTFKVNWTGGEHDVGGAACKNIHRLTIVLFRLDGAFCSASNQPARFDDKATAMDLGHRRERDQVRLAFPQEHVLAFLRAGRPGTGEVDRSRLPERGQDRPRQHDYRQ